MNWLDLVLAGILLASTAAGFMKGFFRLGIGLVSAEASSASSVAASSPSSSC